MDLRSVRKSRAASGRLALSARSRPIQIVVTPASGDGQALATALRLRQALSARGYLSSLEVFSDLDRLHRWAEAERDDRISLLVCVGGDGTQSAAARAAVRRAVPFLPISSGFGNLFARAFDAPRGVRGALDRLLHGQVIRSDVGRCNGELFLCQQSYGLIADVQSEVESSRVPRVRWQRWLSYYRTALRHLQGRPPERFRVVVDGRVVALDAALVIVANVETYGAWLPLTPAASPVDGLFDVFVMRGASHRQVFAQLLRRHLRLPGTAAGTLVCRGQRVQVSRPESTPDQLDVLGLRLPIVVSPATAATLKPRLPRGDRAAPLAGDRAA